MWEDCHLQQTAPVKKGAGTLGLFSPVLVTHWMTHSKVLLLLGERCGTLHMASPLTEWKDRGEAIQSTPSIVEAQTSLGESNSIVTA